MDESLNLLTIDLEEWFTVEILSDRYGLEDWQGLPSTVVENCRRVLDLLGRHDVKATWFVLGWIAERYPDLIEELVHRGHEVACHSFCHRRVDKMTPEVFRRDTEMAIDAIVRAAGNRPRGYRAPSWSINADIPWAFRILAELGFEYDSSLFPIKHDIYGMPEGPRQLLKMTFDDGRYLYELPASTFRILGKNIPVAGGGFFRHSPYWYSKKLITQLNRVGQPAVVYIHPWELDPNPPRVEGLSFLQRFRTYGSTSVLLYKFNKLLEDFRFTTVSEYLYRFKKRRIGFH